MSELQKKDKNDFCAGLIHHIASPLAETEPRPNLSDAAEMLWVVLANVNGGDWTQQSPEWQEAAARWRDNYFAALGPAYFCTCAKYGDPHYASCNRGDARLCNRDSICTIDHSEAK